MQSLVVSIGRDESRSRYLQKFDDSRKRDFVLRKSVPIDRLVRPLQKRASAQKNTDLNCISDRICHNSRVNHLTLSLPVPLSLIPFPGETGEAFRKSESNGRERWLRLNERAYRHVPPVLVGYDVSRWFRRNSFS